MVDIASLAATASAAQLATLIRRRELSPIELMEATLSRIGAIDPKINAFAHLAAAEALEQARLKENSLAKGEKLGLLGGVPVAMKDLYDSKTGWPTTLGGLPALRDNIASANSLWVDRMEAAGAIVVGKTNAAPLGFRGTGDNPLFGPSLNPFNPRFSTGGSSGGAGAAVAAGLLPIAQATDGGGSTRIPAAFCGLVGLKPTFGRIPMIVESNAFGGVSPFLSDGVVTRTVEDSLIALEILEGYDPRDPFSAMTPTPLRPLVNGDVSRLRIGFSPDLGSYPVEDQIDRAVRQALTAFVSAGALIEEVDFGFTADHLEVGKLWCRMIVRSQIDGLDMLAEGGLDILRDHADNLSDLHHYWIHIARNATLRDHQNDGRLRSMLYDKIQSVLNRYDLIITPVTACSGIPIRQGMDTIGPTHINGVEIEPLVGWALTSYFNFTGHPAASVPVGISSEGLPIGMQIVGNRFEDGAVMNAAAFIEKTMPWHSIYERIDLG